MNHATRLGLSVALFAAAMTATTPAHAATEPGYACDSSTLGQHEVTSETAPEGIYYTFWVCTESGWAPYGGTFCDPWGNCSSD